MSAAVPELNNPVLLLLSYQALRYLVAPKLLVATHNDVAEIFPSLSTEPEEF